ncbi:helix-turn-helix domain-containing protein [Cohnella sp. JJ-181]|uniref:helix-turn-helix domain-containing protein n=1 Tax=Cohnella rhizoplanae TaxID=2974897 RepID=UPI0022FF765C|nr:helix-turn-helix domain-containing protein [Cohnella sp. JJ-181]CAI6086788.1 HTH-type transcriptional activator RhaR [Cohnella sp. JJ-181]
MKKIQPILFIRNRTNSLFLRLIAGFLCIVLLLASLTFYSVSESKKNVKHEVVKYNTSLLANTRDSYENHLDLIKKQMLLFFSDEKILLLQSKPSNTLYPEIVREIQRWTTVPYYYINNIVFFSKKNDLVLERGTSTNAKAMFGVFSISRDYPLAFWMRQFEEKRTFRILPASSFYSEISEGSQQPLGEMIPVVIKGLYNPDFIMIVYLNASRMYQAFHQSVNEELLIYDDAGNRMFGRTEGEPFLSFEDLRGIGDSEMFVRDGKYYFAFKGQGTGFTYLSRVPVDRIAAQTRINITLLAIIVAAIALSVLFSFMFAARINNPLKRVIESIRGMNSEGAPLRSNIKEFDIISGQIHGNRMLTRQLSFMNHLKAIRGQESEAPKLDFAGKPFVFLLFQIQPGRNESNSAEVIQNWVYYLRIFIDSKLKPKFPDSLTFQIERDQILSLVFTESMEKIGALLGEMKTVFDQDREHGIMTMAVTSAYSDSKQFTAAYEEAQELAGERLLTDETQIISERVAAPVAVGFSPDQEKELEANLKAGNAAQVAALIEQQFAKWHRKPPTAVSLVRFAETAAAKIRGIVTPFPLDAETVDALLSREGERISRCSTIKELELLLVGWVTEIAQAVREKKDEKHPITTQIAEYINEHLAEEIYLDVLADKFKMSSGYLSSYFKNKTGMNIVDYINETRIKKAAGLLDDDTLKIREAAEQVGYKNITSFNRMFKKYMGLTPSEYRKRNESI